MPVILPFPDIGPEAFAFDLWGMHLALRWYALAYVAGILAGAWLIAVMARRPRLWPEDRPAVTPKQAESLVTWMVIAIILGGRLGYVLFYQPGFYLANPGAILRVWEGGMSFHGGLLGVVIGLAAFARVNRVNWYSVGDAVSAVTPIGLGLGRLANFVNGELWGRASDLPWAMVFPGEAALCAGAVCARHPSQLYEALLEGAVLFALLSFLVWRRGWLRHPGRITGTLFVAYGAARFLVEFLRQPDAQYLSPDNPLGHVALGLTQGQLLTLPMFLAGVFFLTRSAWR
jgi:phosphatidylglycerol:prolipoprotein diacylglycerol transferase